MATNEKLPVNYQDRRLTLRGYKIAVFEPGRELGALIPLVSKKPAKISLQHRSIASKVFSILSTRQGRLTTIAVFDPECIFIVDLVRIAFTERLGEDVFINLLDAHLEGEDVDHSLIAQLRSETHRGVLSGSSDNILSKIRESVGLSILILSPAQYSELLAGISIVSENKFICLICRDMALIETKYPAPVLRQLGIRMLETADGYGEIWGFQS